MKISDLEAELAAFRKLEGDVDVFVRQHPESEATECPFCSAEFNLGRPVFEEPSIRVATHPEADPPKIHGCRVAIIEA